MSFNLKDSQKNNFNLTYLSCIKSLDGQVLFTRQTTDSNEVSSQIISTLSSIFTFGDNNGFRINSIDSNNFKISWKMYHSNLTLILIERLEPIDLKVYFDKLDLIFDSMVLMFGLDDLINISNIEKFQREIKVNFKLIDAILKDNYLNLDLFGGYVTGCVDMILSNESGLFQNVIDNTCLSTNTSYACLIFNGRIITASSAWWQLKTTESHLICLLCLTLSDCSCRDVPIYLPHKNPHQPLRLLTYNLTSSNVVLCLICSEKPAVDVIEPIIKKLWHPVYNSLINMKQYIPRNLSDSITLDKNMIAFLLINKKNKCCTSSLCPNDKFSNYQNQNDAKVRYQLLKYCYLNLSTNFFDSNIETKSNNNNEDNTIELKSCTEAYSLMFDVKFYALNEKYFQFYAIYNQNIPTYALRGVTKTNLNIILNYS